MNSLLSLAASLLARCSGLWCWRRFRCCLGSSGSSSFAWSSWSTLCRCGRCSRCWLEDSRALGWATPTTLCWRGDRLGWAAWTTLCWRGGDYFGWSASLSWWLIYSGGSTALYTCGLNSRCDAVSTLRRYIPSEEGLTRSGSLSSERRRGIWKAQVGLCSSTSRATSSSGGVILFACFRGNGLWSCSASGAC